MGEFREGLTGLRGTAGNSHLFQVSVTGSDGGGRQLAGGGGQPEKGSEELDADDEDPGPGGVRPEDVQFFLKAVVQAVLLFGSDIWVLTPRMERALGNFQHRVA